MTEAPMLSTIRAGDKLIVCPGDQFSRPGTCCLSEGAVVTVYSDPGGLITPCLDGKHFLTADSEGRVIGFTRVPLENAE